MSPSELGKAWADYWTSGGKAFLEAQQSAGRAFAENMKTAASSAVFGLAPDASGALTDLERANKALVDLWSESGALAASLASKSPASNQPGGAMESTFRKMIDPALWLAGSGSLDEALNRMAEGPRLADLWDVERRYTRVFRAWLELRRRSVEHTGVVLQGWLSAGRIFSAEISKIPADDKKSPDAKTILALWIDIANRVLLELERSEQFLDTQRESIRASTELRRAQRDLVEYYGDMFGFPTRTELDDVHKTVTELRRELRALKRKMRVTSSVASSDPEESPADDLLGGGSPDHG